MSIKLIATDMDDTLFSRSLEISERNKQAITEAVSRGVMVTISTGRMFRSAAMVAEQLKLDLPLITYQGALVKKVSSGEVLLSLTIDEETAQEMVAFAEEHNCAVQAYVNDMFRVSYIDKRVVHYTHISKVPVMAVGDLRHNLGGNPHKILISGDPQRMDELWPLAEQQFGSRAYITKSKPYFLELLNPAANKGAALRYLADQFGINKEETMAIGDNFNDIKLFDGAGLKIAMGNAVEPLKIIADYVTEDCDNSGVGIAIEKFVLV